MKSPEFISLFDNIATDRYVALDENDKAFLAVRQTILEKDVSRIRKNRRTVLDLFEKSAVEVFDEETQECHTQKCVFVKRNDYCPGTKFLYEIDIKDSYKKQLCDLFETVEEEIKKHFSDKGLDLPILKSRTYRHVLNRAYFGVEEENVATDYRKGNYGSATYDMKDFRIVRGASLCTELPALPPADTPVPSVYLFVDAMLAELGDRTFEDNAAIKAFKFFEGTRAADNTDGYCPERNVFRISNGRIIGEKYGVEHRLNPYLLGLKLMLGLPSLPCPLGWDPETLTIVGAEPKEEIPIVGAEGWRIKQMCNGETRIIYPSYDEYTRFLNFVRNFGRA